MPLVEVRVSAINPSIELAGEVGYEYVIRVRTIAHSFERVALIVDSVAVRVRDLELQAAAQTPPDVYLQCEVIRVAFIRDERVVAILWVEPPGAGQAVNRFAADQLPPDRAGVPRFEHRVRSDGLLHSEKPVLCVRGS